jgi:hypothetical protein
MNILQSNGIIITGSVNLLHLMLNQVSAQLEVFLDLLRHSVILIIVGTAQSSDNFAKGSNFLILQERDLIQVVVNPLLIQNSLSCSLPEANMDESLPCSSIVGHGHLVIKVVKSAQHLQFCEHFQ